MRTMRKLLICLLFVLVMILSGCGTEKEADNKFKLYFVNTEGTSLVEYSYNPEAETFDKMMEELILQLTIPPEGYISALLDKTAITGYERGIDALRIDFTTGYYKLTNVEEVLLRAAIVKTFVQVPGVSNVMITVDKEQLTGTDGQPIPAMNADTFIETKEGGINSYLSANLRLYFSDPNGNILREELRNLHYSSNMILERVVVEQLIQGPVSGQSRSVLDSATKILSVNVKNGICTINLSDAANYVAVDSVVTAETALYAIVNSVCASSESVTGVRLEIEGESDCLFRDKISLDQVFLINQDMIDASSLSKVIQETELAEGVTP